MSVMIDKTYDDARRRSNEFLSTCGDANVVPIKVYSPFNKKKLSEIQLIRELSSTLQAKKVEEDRKAEAAAELEAKEKEAQKNLAKEAPKEESEQPKEESEQSKEETTK